MCLAGCGRASARVGGLELKILIAPDSFGATLTAPEAAGAIASGWLRHAPADELTLAPMSDGGPGFVSVVAEHVAGTVHTVRVRGPHGSPVDVTWLMDGHTAYIESAQACGLHLTGATEAMTASTFGVGQVVAHAVAHGATRIVVGLGGSGTNDGGAGLLAALGATADVSLDAGPSALADVTHVDVEAAIGALAGVEIVIASDVDSPLLGMFGASKVFGPQKGLTEEQILVADRALDVFVVATCGSTPAQRRIADAPGAGAAGGLGFALMLLGGTRTSGIELVADVAGVGQLASQHDLVITGEGKYDFSSRAGKVVYGVAQIAAQGARPCIVLAGQVDVGAREMRAMGVESAYAVADRVGVERSMADPAAHLADLAQRVARTWSPQRQG